MQLSDTDNNFKFSKGDWVLIISGKNPYNKECLLKKATGKIIKCEYSLKENIYTVELHKNGIEYQQAPLRFPELALIHLNPDSERDWKLKQVLS